MTKLQEIKLDFNKGRMTFENMEWLIKTVEAQEWEIKDYQETLIRLRKKTEEVRTAGSW